MLMSHVHVYTCFPFICVILKAKRTGASSPYSLVYDFEIKFSNLPNDSTFSIFYLFTSINAGHFISK